MSALRRGLEESGLKLGQLSVEIRQDGKPEAHPEPHGNSAQRAPAGWEPKSVAPVTAKSWDRTWQRDATGRVDMMV
jgi:hypothetical protein